MVSNPGNPPTGEVGDDNALADLLDDLEVPGEDSEDGDELEVRFSNFNSIAWSLPRHASAEERRDWAYARQVARQNENFHALKEWKGEEEALRLIKKVILKKKNASNS